MPDSQIENEFSRVQGLEAITKSGTIIEIEATDDERARLAHRFAIPSIAHLKAKCALKKQSQKERGDYKLLVQMDAEVSQRCVMTLEEVSESINEEFLIIFQIDQTDDDENVQSREVDIDVEEDDIEIIKNTEIDIGEFIAEYLSLSLNPYPRQENVHGRELGVKILSEDEVSVQTEKKNPFSVLKELKHKT